MHTSRLKNQTVEVLPGSTYIFGNKDINEVTSLCPSLKCLDYSAGDEVYRQGDTYPYILIIQQGTVKLTSLTVSGKEILVDFRDAGDFLGQELANVSKTSLESALALTKLTIWRFLTTEFKRLISIDPRISQQVIRSLSIREERLKRKLLIASSGNVECRLAYAIQELSHNFSDRCEHGYGKHIQLTHQELADMIGASRPTVSLILNKLRKTGVLNYDRNYLCVKNIEAIVELLTHTI